MLMITSVGKPPGGVSQRGITLIRGLLILQFLVVNRGDNVQV